MAANKNTKDWANLPVAKVFPSTYLTLVEERGKSPDQVLQQAGLPDDFLASRNNTIALGDFQKLINTVIGVVGDDGIGLEVGWRIPPTAYGNFGYALLCSENIRQAVEICQRFWHLISRGMDVSFEVHGDVCVADISLQQEVDNPLRKLSLEGTLSSIYRGFQLLVGPDKASGELWFDFQNPNYPGTITEKFDSIKYGMPRNQFRFPTSLLSHPLEMANPTGFKFAVEQCEREEAISDFGSGQILSRVRKEMVFSMDGYPDLTKLAEILNMTSRTLRRKLEQEGSKYSTLLEQARRRDAIQLLDTPDLDIQKVAELLGYSDPANFTRAFRQWTGQTPSQYRQTRKK